MLLVAIPFHTPYYPIFRSFLNGEFSLCVTTEILSEYEEKLQEKYAARPVVTENTMSALENSPDLLQVTNYFFWNLITADPDDNKFVDCAISAGVDFIVTNDRHFDILSTIEFPKVRVISAEDFVEMLTSVRPL